MPTNEPDEPRRPSAGGGAAGQPSAGGAEQALRALEERLSRASDAAERLIAEAAGAAARGIGSARGDAPSVDPEAHPEPDPETTDRARDGRPPPAGWAPPGPDPRLAEDEVDSLVRFVHSLRDLIPPELQARLGEAVRELLLAVRALIDWYLERMEQRRAAPSAVQDIPIL